MNPTYDQTSYDPEPEKRSEYWQTAFGLQAVDDLEPSGYMRRLAAEHIDGKKTYEQIKSDLKNHYAENQSPDEEEADKVSEAIYEILNDGAFSFEIATLKNYHRRLFENLNNAEVFHPGEFRKVNITKKEPILDGDTVQYQDFGMLEDSLTYDFAEEKSQNYVEMSEDARIKRLAEFISHIWQVHPFIEGNTRTTAVFIEKYLSSLGYKVDNEPFEKDALYFRNALVRANYTNIPKNVSADRKYLEKFLKNLLSDDKVPLDNSELKI